MAIVVGKGGDAASAMDAAVEANADDVALLLVASSAYRAAKRFDDAAKARAKSSSLSLRHSSD